MPQLTPKQISAGVNLLRAILATSEAQAELTAIKERLARERAASASQIDNSDQAA